MQEPPSPRPAPSAAVLPQRRLLRAGLNGVIALGVAIALWPAGQAAYGWWSQRQLMAAWPDESSAPAEATRPATSLKAANGRSKQTSPTSTSAPSTASAVSVSAEAPGSKSLPVRDWPATRIRIPDIGLDAVVVQGLDEKSLARGPGHHPRSGLPGEWGNCVIAGHRNVYGSWFYRLDELWAGSTIELRTPQGRFKYQVLSVSTVSEADYTVLQPPSSPEAAPRLTLITCTLPHSPFRIVATAEMMPE
jgi:LPXTG-site transpeptidase (sortase) family protein